MDADLSEGARDERDPHGMGEEVRWMPLLAHHPPARYDRCLALRIGRLRLHLCARCTGLGIGAVVFAGLAVLPGALLLRLVELPLVAGVALAPLPAAVDWTGQALRAWESTNLRRLVTGTLLGFAWLVLLAAIVLRPWPDLLGIGVVAAYAIGIVAVLTRRGALEEIVGERFPGLRS